MFNYNIIISLGANYLISVNDVINSERKVKMNSILNIYTKKSISIPVQDYLKEFSTEQSKYDENFAKVSYNIIWLIEPY